jgi:RimJ/RimL family protein N-acetyltransferase
LDPPSARRLGHATAALKLVCDWSFRDLGIDRLSMLIDLDNEASKATARKTGFGIEAELPDHEVLPGARRDLLLWSRRRARP